MIAQNNITSTNTKPPAPNTKGQRTANQRMAYGMLMGWGGVNGGFGSGFGGFGYADGGWGMGLGEFSAMGIGAIWPGWNSLLWGTYWTYRTMMRHPTIGYVMDQIVAVVSASQWLVDADEDADPDAINWIKENIIAKRDVIAPHALTAVIFGNAPFEIVWSNENGLSISDFIPLLQDHTRILRDSVSGKGAWLGIRNGDVDLSASECLWVMNTSEALGAEPGQDYGRSRLENIRDTAWVGWLDTARRLAELEDRVSGSTPLIEVPTTAKDANGMTMADYARAMLMDLTAPRSIGGVIENPNLAEVNADTTPNTYEQLRCHVDMLDHGDRAESQKAMLDKMRYWDDCMGRGLYRGERTLFSTKGASRADSEQHSLNVQPDAECVDAMVVKSVNRGPINTALQLKFGKAAAKKIRGIKPVPLVDKERISMTNLLNSFAQNTIVGPILYNTLDRVQAFNIAGYPLAPQTSTDGNDARPKPQSTDPTLTNKTPDAPVAPQEPQNSGNDKGDDKAEDKDK